MNLFANIIDPDRILKMQQSQYSEKILLTDTVPAGTQKLGKKDISSLGHFYCQFISGHFQTLKLDEAAIIDDGVSHLRGKLVDGSNQRQLFDDYVPLDLWLSPGRTLSSSDTNIGDLTKTAPGGVLFYPQPYVYLFAINSKILFDVKNDSDVDLQYEILFQGIRLPEAPRVGAQMKKAKSRKLG